MTKTDIHNILQEFSLLKGLKHSEKRHDVLRIVLKSSKHMTVNEICESVRQEYPSIGQATVYRTIKLLCECEICRELRTEDGLARYEVVFGHEHHDHLICLGCGKFEEVVDLQIEDLQMRLVKKKGYTLENHKLMLYGYCPGCQKKK